MTEVNAEETFSGDAFVHINATTAVRVRISEFPEGSGRFGLDIRRFIQSDRYTGATRKGIWIPIENRSKEPVAARVVKQCCLALAKHLDVHPADLSQGVFGFDVPKSEEKC